MAKGNTKRGMGASWARLAPQRIPSTTVDVTKIRNVTTRIGCERGKDDSKCYSITSGYQTKTPYLEIVLSPMRPSTTKYTYTILKPNRRRLTTANCLQELLHPAEFRLRGHGALRRRLG